MNCNIGTSIKYLREKKGIRQKAIYDGLCSQATFSRIELGEKEMDQLLFYALLSRLGISSNKYTLVLQKKDIELMKQREEIEYVLKNQEWKDVEEKLAQYERNDFGGTTKKLHDQYINMIKAKQYEAKGEIEKAKEELIIGIRRTNKRLSDFINGKQDEETYYISEYYISEMEFIQVCMYCELLEKQGETSQKVVWKWLYHYIEKYIKDTEYKIKVYPVCSYYIALAYKKEGNWMECLAYCNRAIDFLKRYKNLLFLKELLTLHQMVSEEIGLVPKKENIDYLSMLNFIEENLLEQKVVEKRERLGVYFIGDVIKNTREYVGVSQEQLAYTEKDGKGKADPSTLSNIENGHRIPRRTTSNYYFQKLGLGQYQMEISPVIGEDFELQELRWKIDYMLSQYKFEEAKELCKEIEEKLDMSMIQNQQYIERIKVILEYYPNKIKVEEYRDKLIQVLRMTWSDYDIADTRKITRFLSNTEEILFINIVQTYMSEQNYEVAIRLYKKLKEYFENIYDKSGYGVYALLCLNLEQTLGLSKYYKESMEQAKEGIQIEYRHSDMRFLYYHLYNIGWNYGKLSLETNNDQEKYKKACQCYLEQALKGANFMENIEIVRHIQEQKRIYHIS